MNGFLLIDKPAGWTSHDVVAKIRGLLKNTYNQQKIKVGHAGTLDPLATGLLIVLVGDYCKRAQEFSQLDKMYSVTVKLGQTSTTDDEEGEKTNISTVKPDLPTVKNVIKRFIGQIQQTPPLYSAIKVDGKRAYKEARKGKSLQLQPRTISIYAISNILYGYPFLVFNTTVSSGTYIRSLARDIGHELKTGAYLSALRRATIAHYSVSDATLITDLTTTNIATKLKQ